jgi:hypothetical protein
MLEENRRKQSADIEIVSKGNNNGDLSIVQKERAKTALSRPLSTTQHSTQNLFEEDEEEEELQRKLEEYESMLRRAEYLRQMRLEESVERVHQNNLKIYEK